MTLDVVGDICLGYANRNQIDAHGADYPFEQVRTVLLESDLRYGNLEMIFSDGKGRKPKSDLWARDRAIECIRGAGFNVLSMANNHVMDDGDSGLKHTIALLDSAGIAHCGAGRDMTEARKPAVTTCRGLRIGFLSCADDQGQIAGRRRSGAAEMNRKSILADIRALRKSVDVVVVSFHAGLEFSAYPSPYQIALSRMAVKAGADVVLGGHPHFLQGMETYGKGMICYSLGSFIIQVYGNDYLSASFPYASWSMILRIRLTRNGYGGHRIIPLVIGNDHRPHPAQGESAQSILVHVEHVSGKLSDPEFLTQAFGEAARYEAHSLYWSLRLMLARGKYGEITRYLRTFARTQNRRWIGEFLKRAHHGLRPRRAPFVSVYDSAWNPTGLHEWRRVGGRKGSMPEHRSNHSEGINPR